MKRMKRYLALLLAACLLLALAACGPAEEAPASPSPEAEASPSPSPSPTPAPDAKRFTAFLGAAPRYLDPSVNTSANGETVLGHMLEGLMKWDGGEETLASGVSAAKLVGGAAERYERTESDDDRVVYTFHLRPTAKWSDGKAVTAQDFVYAWQRLLDPDTQADYAYLLSDVVNAKEVMAGTKEVSELAVRAVDEATFEVTLAADAPDFLQICAMACTAPLRQDAIEQAGGSVQWTYSAETFLSNGPYCLESWTQGSQVALKRNEHYGAADGPDTIVFLFGDDADGLSAFRAGSLDFAKLSAGDEETALTALPLAAVNYLTFATDKAPFDDVRVRRAFALAVDRTALCERLGSAYAPATALVPTGISDAEGQGDFREQGGNYLEPDAAAFAAARELLAQAGYAEGAGFPTVRYLYSENETHRAVAEVLRDTWQKELGVTVELEECSWGDYLAALHAGQFDIARGRWIADRNDPGEFLALFRSGADGGYANAHFDDLLDRAAAATLADTRMGFFHQAEDQLIGQDWALAPLSFERRCFVKKEGWTGLCYQPLGQFRFTGVKLG